MTFVMYRKLALKLGGTQRSKDDVNDIIPHPSIYVDLSLIEIKICPLKMIVVNVVA